MANWCTGSVVFSGKNTSQFKQDLLSVMTKIEESSKNCLGVRPAEMLGKKVTDTNSYDEGYLFFLAIAEDKNNDNDYLRITFETRWSPMIRTILDIVEAYNIEEFEYWYDESGNAINGEFVYKDGVLHDFSLTKEEYESCLELDDEEGYDFSYEEADDIITQKKIKANLSN
jgi:hypothetical protein